MEWGDGANCSVISFKRPKIQIIIIEMLHLPNKCVCVVFVVIHGECRLPVCSQPGGYVSSRDLCHDVAPEKRSVNQPHRLWIPIELGFLMDKVEITIIMYNIVNIVKRTLLEGIFFSFKKTNEKHLFSEWIDPKPGLFIKGLRFRSDDIDLISRIIHLSKTNYRQADACQKTVRDGCIDCWINCLKFDLNAET